MKRSLLLAAAFACCAYAQTLISHVIAPATLGSGGGTSNSINTSGANFLHAQVTYFDGATAPTLSDSKSNSWTALTAYCSSSSYMCSREYYVQNPTVGTGHTFTISGASSYSTALVDAFSGMLTSGVFNAGTDSGHGGFDQSQTIQPGSITPPTGSQLVLTGIGDGNTAGQTYSVNLSFTITDQVPFTSGQAFGTGSAYLVQNPGAAVNPTWTVTGANAVVTASIASFSAASAGATKVRHTVIGLIRNLSPVLAAMLDADDQRTNLVNLYQIRRLPKSSNAVVWVP